MPDRAPDSNPFAVPGAGRPRTGWYDVNDCRLYVEIRGEGPALLISGAASDDAEMFRPIAERLVGFTVVTFDPRGTRRSSRSGWPCDSAQHADDAGDLLRALHLVPAHVFGASAGGIVAVQLALRHPDLVGRVLVCEPGYFRCTPAGAELYSRARASVDEHLIAHPEDWAGALAAGLLAAQATPPRHDSLRELLEPPAGLDWYAARAHELAENFIRDDVPLTGEVVDRAGLARSAVDFQFVSGSESNPVFREIVEELSRIRPPIGRSGPVSADVITGAGHVAYFTPELIADYIRGQCPEPAVP
ncbi:alpha/beta hydrolase [Cryobacterium frigoriphilum]|uniref:Alpha/beta hydrolase n=1 Tax=Cryobacterium frigoriphilum TaxID=1259150 RepID=A0A4V3IRW3_9MICO|nr:alpha/beta hydrolase [Cryobacterium frigoriphilum]TFD53983.1 alpha/beta hydrolase [Cryobacterium frigoriphilum]